VKHPIDNIQWIETDLLEANGWNPNVVLGPEFQLIKFSLLKQGWIQPVLVAALLEGRYQIIDGFHRSTLAKTDKDIIEAFGTCIPCAVLDIDEAERKMLTVRINRAKGSHQAFLMGDLVKSLVRDHEIPIPELCRQLGAEKTEIELLLQEDVFAKMDVASMPYSRAWGVKDRRSKRAK